MTRLLCCISLCLLPLARCAAETWQAALDRMPLGTNVTQLNRTNCVGIMLRAFRSNDVVKALVFMPGATDEFYFFRRARADLTNSPASLLDAVSALTYQTHIRATFRPPLLLLHTDADLLEPVIKIEHQPTADKLRQARFVRHGVYNDCDWDFLRPVLRSSLRTDLRPWPHSPDSWHFYRHSFAAWNLTGWEALECTALAGRTAVTVRRRQVVFEPDARPRATPKALGMWNSQTVLLALIKKGLTRERAYELVQANAMRTWEAKHAGRDDADFLSQLKSDPEVAKHFKAGELEALCSLDFHFKEVKNRFRKLGL